MATASPNSSAANPSCGTGGAGGPSVAPERTKTYATPEFDQWGAPTTIVSPETATAAPNELSGGAGGGSSFSCCSQPWFAGSKTYAASPRGSPTTTVEPETATSRPNCVCEGGFC